MNMIHFSEETKKRSRISCVAKIMENVSNESERRGKIISCFIVPLALWFKVVCIAKIRLYVLND